MERTLNKLNIDNAIRNYELSIADIGKIDSKLTGIKLFQYLKRSLIGLGPYPHVTLFEAANRIMTDLVILKGIKWILDNNSFPFEEYCVEYGNEDKNDHDIMAASVGKRLIGEAFNVAPSFFSGKRYSTQKKLRSSSAIADYKLIIANSDSVKDDYHPPLKDGEYFLYVDIETGEGRLLS